MTSSITPDYPLPYDERAAQRFAVGAAVVVGPAYHGRGVYQADGWEGAYTVIDRDGADHALSATDSNREVWVYASRLMPAPA